MLTLFCLPPAASAQERINWESQTAEFLFLGPYIILTYRALFSFFLMSAQLKVITVLTLNKGLAANVKQEILKETHTIIIWCETRAVPKQKAADICMHSIQYILCIYETVCINRSADGDSGILQVWESVQLPASQERVLPPIQGIKTCQRVKLFLPLLCLFVLVW